jgi:hypothetical protein
MKTKIKSFIPVLCAGLLLLPFFGFVSVRASDEDQKVPPPQIHPGLPLSSMPGYIKGYKMVVNHGINFSVEFNVVECNNSEINPFNNKPYGLSLRYQGNFRSYVSGNWLLFQFGLGTSLNDYNPRILYINCSGSVIPIYLSNCNSFDMVTSGITYMGGVPTFTNVITFRDIALETYGHGSSSINLVFTQKFIANDTKLTVKTITCANFTNMKLFYSEDSPVPFNTTFSLNLKYSVCLISQTDPGPQGKQVFIIPTRITKEALFFEVDGTGGMRYSFANMTMADNYTEVQSSARVLNKTADVYFAPGWVVGGECFQRFTNLTYGVTMAVISDPTIDVHHASVLMGVGSGSGWVFPVAFMGGIASVAVVATLVVVRRRRRR